MDYIAGIFFFLYAFSTVFLIYSHKQETGSYKKAFKKYSGDLFVILTPFILLDNSYNYWCMYIVAYIQ